MSKPAFFLAVLLFSAALISSVSAHGPTVPPTEPPTVGSGDFRTIGFWKHQFAVATSNNNGKAQISASDLQGLLDELDANWTTFSGTTLGEGYDLLWLKKASMEERARQQCFATLLNWANGAVAFGELVDTDYDGFPDTTFSDAMADALTGSDYENNKNICDSINNMNP